MEMKNNKCTHAPMHLCTYSVRFYNKIQYSFSLKLIP